ncbi:MAG: PLP-dependent aminotransferase family protein [Anaerolineae bacterium]|jgi:DNA-binding transcriptional MocR family regulator
MAERTMKIDLRRDSAVPLYLQIRDRLRERIESGILLPDTKLPPTRTLAEELGVSRVTVVNAYAELEAEGWVRAHVGRGTFVTDPQRRDLRVRETPYDWQTRLLRPAGVSASGMLADMLQLAQQPDLISFGMGAPATELLPVRDFREAINYVLRRDGPEALQYDEAAGYEPLRRAITHLLLEKGIEARSRDVLITSGSQQGLDLVARVFTKPGDLVVTESPTYLGALDVFQSQEVTLRGVPVDEEGMRVDVLAELISRRRPSLVYTIPAFHNPTGVTLSPERRRRMLGLARQHNVLVLEDGVCSELRYEGGSVRSLYEMDGEEHVVHVNSFSKFLLPGIRVGYLVAQPRLIERLVTMKQSTDLFTSSLMQRALAEYLERGHLEAHVETIRRVYRERRDAMLAGLARYLPKEAYWTSPQGGLCLWLTLPESISAAQLYLSAIDHGVAFAVGSVFFPQNPAGSSLRLNFAAHSPAQIDEGLRRLGRAVREQMRGSSVASSVQTRGTRAC